MREEIYAFGQEKQMPYVTSFERLAKEEGKAEGRREGEASGLKAAMAVTLKARFGKAGSRLMPRIKQLNDLEQLRNLTKLIVTAKSLDEISSACAAITC